LPWTNKEDSLWRITFTGISPVVRSFCYQQEQLERMTTLPTQVFSQIKALLDSRGFSAALTEKFGTISTVGATENDTTKEEDQEEVKKMANFSTIPSDYKLNPVLSPLAVWLNWHHGEILDKKRDVRSPPWKALESRDMAKKSTTKERASTRKSLSNLRLFCGCLDMAAGFGQTSRPTEEELSQKFFEKDSDIAGFLNELGTTTKGRTRRVDECQSGGKGKSPGEGKIPGTEK